MYHGTHESFQRNLIMGGQCTFTIHQWHYHALPIQLWITRTIGLAHRPLEVKCVGALKERKKGRKKETKKLCEN